MTADPEGSRATDPAGHSRLDVVVRGVVQGVGYRYFAWREAMDLDLLGWVANEMDGSVRCLAEGPRVRLEAFVTRLEAGPPAALVERVDAHWMPAIGGLGPFAVRSGAHRGD